MLQGKNTKGDLGLSVIIALGYFLSIQMALAFQKGEQLRTVIVVCETSMIYQSEDEIEKLKGHLRYLSKKFYENETNKKDWWPPTYF